MMNAQEFQRDFFGELPQEQFLSLFNFIPDASVFLKNREGQFVALNQNACEYCGISDQADAIGKTDFDFFETDRALAYLNDDRDVMTTGESVINRIESSPESIRSPRLVVTCKIPIRNLSGDIVGIAGLSRRVDEFRDSSDTIGRFSKVVSYLHNHYEEPVSTAKLARQVGVSASQFNRRFRQAFGTSLRQYLLRIRVEAATQMLVKTDETVVAIALDCGFHDHSHFSRSFKRLMHCSPTDYREKRNRGS